MKKAAIFFVGSCFSFNALCQLKWQNVDTLFSPLPLNFHVYFSNDSLDGKPNKAYYVEATLKDKNLNFTVDTTLERRLTPTQFFEKNQKALLVVNTSFFSFQTHKNLGVVIKNKKQIGFNTNSTPLKGKDTLLYNHVFGSALGINKKGEADIAWILNDSSKSKPLAFQSIQKPFKDSFYTTNLAFTPKTNLPKKWKMKTAVGGGPVLMQIGEIVITNNEEQKFTGKAINDKHPRTAMGYTNDGKLIVLVVEGRNPKIAEGVSLNQLAKIFKGLNCIEALNLDGGGSSCMLINGKPTIKVSDKEGQRPVPCVFIINSKK